MKEKNDYYKPKIDLEGCLFFHNAKIVKKANDVYISTFDIFPYSNCVIEVKVILNISLNKKEAFYRKDFLNKLSFLQKQFISNQIKKNVADVFEYILILDSIFKNEKIIQSGKYEIVEQIDHIFNPSLINLGFTFPSVKFDKPSHIFYLDLENVNNEFVNISFGKNFHTKEWCDFKIKFSDFNFSNSRRTNYLIDNCSLEYFSKKFIYEDETCNIYDFIFSLIPSLRLKTIF